MPLVLLCYSAEAVYLAELLKQTFLFCTINLNMKSQHKTKLKEFCLIYLVCAARANTRLFNNLSRPSAIIVGF